MKTLLIAIVIILLAFAGFQFIIKNRASYEAEIPELKKQAPVEGEVLVDTTLSETKTFNAPTAFATFDVAYPTFKNASVEFNQKIEDLVMSAVAEHKKIAEDTWRAQAETGGTPEEKFQFYASWTPVQVNDNYISVLLREGGYTGGAHGYEMLTSFNFDVMGEKEIVLSDLFPGDPNYLKAISEFARKELRRQLKENLNEDMLLPGTEPRDENFSVFSFTPGSLTFYFQQYQVAPYAAGQSKVTMPRD
ncbi:MAG: DUF3298 and DUF4163 domain-containing protein [Patescibacteria group bacterium]